MKFSPFTLLVLVVFCTATDHSAFAQQENIPQAIPLEDDNSAPLRSSPRDLLDIADNLYSQAQAPEVKSNPDEYKQSMNLAAEWYAKFIKASPEDSRIPLAMYRMADCLMQADRKAEAFPIFADIQSRDNGEISAAAAYRLATEAYKTKDWPNAERFYKSVIQRSSKANLKTDAAFRLARITQERGDKDNAIAQFRIIYKDPKASLSLRQSSAIILAGILTSAGQYDEAFQIYRDLVSMDIADPNTMGRCLVQAATLASRLNFHDEARKYYAKIEHDPNLKSFIPGGQIGIMTGLYKAKRYKDITDIHEMGTHPFNDPAQEARRKMLVGLAYYKQNNLDRAKILFSGAENAVPGTELAMEAGYRKLLCINGIDKANFVPAAISFLNAYATAFPASVWPEMVRLQAAENLYDKNPAEAAKFYMSINFDRLPAKLRPSILYKAAFAIGKAGNRESSVKLLDEFINKNPSDQRLPVAFAYRGTQYVQLNDENRALSDFETVIKRWPRNDAAATAWQQMAFIYKRRQDIDKMIQSYEGLVTNFPKTTPAALAEARFMIGRAYLDKKQIDKAIPNLEEARTLNPKQFDQHVAVLLVLAYYQQQDVQNISKLQSALEDLGKKYPDSLKTIPEAIPIWVGRTAFNQKDYLAADKYLTLATKNDESQSVKKDVWLRLARARLALKRYDRALVAVNHYLDMETKPYPQADALLDKANILLGLNNYAEARKAAEDALALGVEGPITASLRLVLGDVSFAEGKYDDAAKYYGTTAEVFADKTLKPQALYKAAEALEKAGRVNDAVRYRAKLQQEFPDWKPAP